MYHQEVCSQLSLYPRSGKCFSLIFPVPIPDGERKLMWIFIFTLLCGVAKGFMKALKAFVKHFEAPQGSVKISMSVNFYLKAT